MADPQFDPTKPFDVVEETFDPEQPFEVVAEEEVPEWLKTVGTVAGEVSEAAAAPFRAGLAPIAAEGAAGILKAPGAALEQIGEEAAIAPTGMELAAMAGIPKEAKVPTPEIEPGMGVSFSPEQIQQAMQALGIKTPELPPTEVLAREMAATGLSMVEPDIGPALPPAIKAAGYGAGYVGALGARGVGKIGSLAMENVIKPGAVKTAELAGKAVGAVKSLPDAVKAAKSSREGAQIMLKAIDSLPQQVKFVYNSLRPEIQKRFIEHYATADRHGIDPDLIVESPALMYGEDSFVAKAKAAAKSFGVDKLTENWNKLNSQISEAINREIQKLSIPKGQIELFEGQPQVTRVSAGQGIRTAFNRKVKQLFDTASVRYSTVLRQSPELAKATMSEDTQINLFNTLALLEEKELRTLQYSSDDAVIAQANANLQQIRSLGSAVADNNLSAIIPQMQQLGREAFELKTKKFAPVQFISPQQQVKQNLYFAIQKAVLETVDEIDPQIGLELKAGNALQSRFFEQSKKISQVIANEMEKGGEHVYAELIAGGDSLKLDALKTIIGDQPEFLQARAQYLRDVLRLNQEGNVIYTQVRKSLFDDQKKRILGTLFEPGELQGFEDLLQMGADMGRGEFNPSGSGVLATLAAAAKDPIAAIKAGSIGDAFIAQLEKEGIQRYLQGMPISQIKSLRKNNVGGLYQKFGPEIDEALRKIESSPEYVRAHKQLQKAKEFSPVDPIIGEGLEEAVSEATPDSSYLVVKDFLKNTFTDLGVGIGPIGVMSPYAGAYRTMMTLYNTAERLGTLEEPVKIPEDDREMVKQVILQSDMDSIQKTRNFRSLNNTGYLLNLSGLKKQMKDQDLKKRLFGPSAKLPEKKDEALAADEMGPLDRLARKPAGELETEYVGELADEMAQQEEPIIEEQPTEDEIPGETYEAMEEEPQDAEPESQKQRRKEFDELVNKMRLDLGFSAEQALNRATKIYGSNPWEEEDEPEEDPRKFEPDPELWPEGPSLFERTSRTIKKKIK